VGAGRGAGRGAGPAGLRGVGRAGGRPGLRRGVGLDGLEGRGVGAGLGAGAPILLAKNGCLAAIFVLLLCVAFQFSGYTLKSCSSVESFSPLVILEGGEGVGDSTLYHLVIRYV